MPKDKKFKKVLYVTTQVAGSWRYFSWCAYPAIWYARLQNKILSFLNTCDDVKIFVKFYPNEGSLNPNISWVENHNSNFVILNNSLINILTKYDFDLIITEAFATTFLEIICTKSQILIFIPKDFTRIDENSKEMLKKRVFFAENEDEYLDLLCQLMNFSDTIQFKDLNDNFLLKFGIHSPDADPILLSRQAIQSIISESSIS